MTKAKVVNYIVEEPGSSDASAGSQKPTRKRLTIVLVIVLALAGVGGLYSYLSGSGGNGGLALPGLVSLDPRGEQVLSVIGEVVTIQNSQITVRVEPQAGFEETLITSVLLSDQTVYRRFPQPEAGSEGQALTAEAAQLSDLKTGDQVVIEPQGRIKDKAKFKAASVIIL